MPWPFAGMQGRLGILQKTMLQWNELHPYSAVHVAHVRGPLAASRLRRCIHTIVEKRGLTHLELTRERSTFQYHGGPADCEILTIAGAEGPWSALVAEMERQLNLRFDLTAPFSPFRFLVAPAGDSFFLGLVYFHPMADAESVVRLLKEIVVAYTQEDMAGLSDPLDLYPDPHFHLLRRHPRALIRKLMAMPAQARHLRQAHRPHYRDAGDLTNGFVSFSLAPDDLRALRAAARSWAVTVNDLFLALLLKSLSPCAAARDRARRRRSIAAGCIVNVRKDLGIDSGSVFGLFLGSFTVTHDVPASLGLRRLAEDIRQQTAPIKRRRLYLGTPLDLSVARFALRFFSPERRKGFYAKHHPLWGGVTNMNLNQLWEVGDRHALLDYFRGVSTGPVTPLVLSVTTVGDRVNLGLTYRTTVFSRTDIENLQGRFREHLDELRANV